MTSLLCEGKGHLIAGGSIPPDEVGRLNHLADRAGLGGLTLISHSVREGLYSMGFQKETLDSFLGEQKLPMNSAIAPAR
jgi:hypothetical protein